MPLDGESCRKQPLSSSHSDISTDARTVGHGDIYENSDFPTHLSFRTSPQGIELQLLFDLFDMPTLRYLQVDHSAWNNKVDLRRYWKLSTSPCRFMRPRMPPYNPLDNTLHLEKVLPHHRRRKAFVDSLTLSVPAADPDVAELLFLWPARLRSITFTQIVHSFYSSAYTSVVIAGFLEIHRESLTTVELPALPDQGLPDFSSFANLQRLHIHASSVIKKTPYEAWSKLAAPSLY